VAVIGNLLKRLRIKFTFLAFVLIASAAPARAHVFTITNVLAILKSDGTFQIDMSVDVDALALGVPPTTDSKLVMDALQGLSQEDLQRAIQQAKDTMLNRTTIRFDGQKAVPRITFPQHGSLAAQPEMPSLLGIIARLEGTIPPGAKEFTFAASRSWAAVNLTILDQSALTGVRYPLGPGEESAPYNLGEPPESSSRQAYGVLRYLILGFEHIIPEGLDHVLFVLGLFLLSTRLKALLWQVTAFTVAHSVTLGLAIYGVVNLPSHIVEPLIALSIAYVAVENIVTPELKPWRPVVVFLFGLLHGMGFAGALRDLGLPREDFAKALVLFNVGVELGQLTVIALAFLTIGWFRHRPWYRKVIVIPASSLIAVVGLYWAITRTLV
jgi:hypothetical protein